MEASKVVCNCSFRPYFRGNRFMRTFTVGCFAAFALAFSAPAATIDSDFPVAQGGNWAYPVSLNISSGESITTGNFFTIFDVPGLLNAAAPADWSVSIQNTGVRPPNVLVIDTALANVTFQFNGTTISGPATVTGFEFLGPSPNYQFSDAAARTTISAGGVSSSSVVFFPQAVPEPATAALGALALGMLVAARRIRARR
jgi:hypothetical protein